MSTKIRKLATIGMALALGLAVVACGGSAAEAPAPAAPQAPASPQAPQASAPAPAPAAPAAAPAAPAPVQAMPGQPARAPVTQAQRAATAAPAQATLAPAAAPAAPAAPAQSQEVQKMSGQSHAGGQVAQSQSAAGPRGGQPGATTFEDYERTGFEHTMEDRVSTFSLDTDRTSYHLALNWARAGYDVEPDSVRAEEWINAFNYGYCPFIKYQNG